MNRSLHEYLRCIINGNDTRYTEWSTDVKLFPLSYNSHITTTLGLSPYEIVFIQKPQKSIMFTAISSENTQGYCQPTKESLCFNLPLHTHDEDHFHHPQISKLASGTLIDWILNRDKKQNENYQKVNKNYYKDKLLIPNQFSIHTSCKLKNRHIRFQFQILSHKKEILKNYNHLEYAHNN